MGWRSVVLATLVLALAALGFATPAAAAPDNKHAVSREIDCEGFGPITVIENGHWESPLAFGPDGQVFVGKSVSATSEVTVAIAGGPTVQFTEEFREAGPGKGFQDRLIECTFADEFEEELILDEEAIAFIEEGAMVDLEAFLGATATVSGVSTVTVLAMAPGN